MAEGQDEGSAAPEYWLKRAAQTRARAGKVELDESREAMLEVARAYERIANWTTRLREILKNGRRTP